MMISGGAEGGYLIMHALSGRMIMRKGSNGATTTRGTGDGTGPVRDL